MCCHLMVYHNFIWITIFPPKKSQIVFLLFWNLQLVKHSFISPVTFIGSSLKQKNTPTTWIVKYGPGNNSLLIDAPQCSALRSNTTHIFPGLLGWYSPWCGKYQQWPDPVTSDDSLAFPFDVNSLWTWYSHPLTYYSLPFSFGLISVFFLPALCCLETVHLLFWMAEGSHSYHLLMMPQSSLYLPCAEIL